MTDLLIVVDMQRDFVSGALGSEQARAIVPAVAARIQQAKAENTQVVFTLDTHEENYMNTREGRFLPVPHCIRGTWGRALADVVTVTSPQAIFLFGGLSKAGKLIFEPTQWYMEENMLFVFKNKVKLLPSGIQGKNAAILGASALIWQEAAK